MTTSQPDEETDDSFDHHKSPSVSKHGRQVTPTVQSTSLRFPIDQQTQNMSFGFLPVGGGSAVTFLRVLRCPPADQTHSDSARDWLLTHRDALRAFLWAIFISSTGYRVTFDLWFYLFLKQSQSGAVT